MLNYGRQIIKNLIEKWTKSHRLHYEYISRLQADSHRSDIRMFEAWIPAQRYGNNEQSASDLASEDCLRLIEIAKEHNLFFAKDSWDNFGDRKRLPSGESIVYLSPNQKNVIKIRNPFAKAAIKNLKKEDIIFEHLIHNILFPNTQYTFKGISEDLGELRIIYSQPYVPMNFIPPSQKQIDKYIINALGLKKEDAYFYGNDYLSITDVSADSDNVLVAMDGVFYFIDPIIRFKKRAWEIWDYYYPQLS
jgi:hypothetical protein